MSNYLVEFTAYVDERRRPENFPHEIHVQDIFENVESITQLQYLVNDKFVKLVSSAGLIALKDPDEPLESGVITFDRRMFVSWGILTHMTVSVKQITEPASSISLVPPPIKEKEPKEMVN